MKLKVPLYARFAGCFRRLPPPAAIPVGLALVKFPRFIIACNQHPSKQASKRPPDQPTHQRAMRFIVRRGEEGIMQF